MKYSVVLFGLTMLFCCDFKTSQDKSRDLTFELIQMDMQCYQLRHNSVFLWDNLENKNDKLVHKYLLYERSIEYLFRLNDSLVYVGNGLNSNGIIACPYEEKNVQLFFFNPDNGVSTSFNKFYASLLLLDNTKHSLLNYKKNYPVYKDKHLKPCDFYFKNKNLYECVKTIRLLTNYLSIKQSHLIMQNYPPTGAR